MLDLKPAPDGTPPLRVPPNIPTLEARALIVALTTVADEGLVQVIKRHKIAAASAIAGITALGLEPWQKNSRHYSTLTTTVRVNGEQKLLIKQPIGIVAPGDGELSGQLLRINHFGANANREGVEGAVRTLAGLLKQDAEQAVQAARQVWGEAL